MSEPLFVRTVPGVVGADDAESALSPEAFDRDAPAANRPAARATLVTDAGELERSEETLVATSAAGPFVPLGDALDHDPAVREALLALSPDPLDFRWRRYRALALAAPVSWGVFVANDWQHIRGLSIDAQRVMASPAFRAAEADPARGRPTILRRARIDRALSMRYGYVGVEGALAIGAAVVVLTGARRWRAVPFAAGVGAAAWWVFHAGRPERCFGVAAWRETALATLGAFGAVATIALAPSETSIARRLRARLGMAPTAPAEGAIDGPQTRERRTAEPAPRRLDLGATIAMTAAGVALPVLLEALRRSGVPDKIRLAIFAAYCILAFLGGLVWRRESTRVAPTFAMLAVLGGLGFGITAASDVAARATLEAVVEVDRCAHPDSKLLGKVRDATAKETAAARRDTQASPLAFWIAVLAAPLCEEMLYRGGLQRVARRALGSRAAMMLSALVFGLAHMGVFRTAFYQHIGLGLAFASVFELAGGGAVGIVASAATHALWNFWLAATPVF